MKIRMGNLRIQAVPGSQLVVLEELNGSRKLRITVDNISRVYIEWQVKNLVDPANPDIFGFSHNLVNFLSSTIEEVYIYDLVKGKFRSRVTIMDGRINQPFNLELHVTNAIALAVSAECPIFVEEDVFKKCDEYLETAVDEKSKDTIRKIFDSMDPDSLTKH